jgi:hypothetical protein
VTLHQKNVHKIGDIARFLLEEVGLPSFSTNAASHMGLCRRNAKGSQLTPQEPTWPGDPCLWQMPTLDGSALSGPLATARIGCPWNRTFVSKNLLQATGVLRDANGPMKTLAVRGTGSTSLY